MIEPKFKVGDVVMIEAPQIQSPFMIVNAITESVFDDGPMYACIWFSIDTGNTFKAETLHLDERLLRIVE